MNALTFPALPGVLRRCSPVIVHDDGTRLYGSAPPEDLRGVVVSDWWESPPSVDPVTGVEYLVGGWLVAVKDDDGYTQEWSLEIPAWTLALDLSDPTGFAHLRDWLAAILLKTRGRRTPSTGSTWRGCRGTWTLRVDVGHEGGCEDFFFNGRRIIACQYRHVPGLSAKLPPAEALRLCALHIARERGLLPTIETP